MDAPKFASPSRPALTPPVESQLSLALRAHVNDPSEATTAKLRDALAAAACDARQQGLQSEELVIVFKSIEMQWGRLREGDGRSPDSRNQLFRALLDAFYAPQRTNA